MNPKFKCHFHLLLLALVTLVSCTNKTFTDFKYSKKASVINYPDKELNPLLNEALYSFENDILSHFCIDHPSQTLEFAYANFISLSVKNQIDYTEIVSPHTAKLFEALKAYEDLWDTENPISALKYKSKFFEYVALNIKDPNLHTTLIALVSTNSMSPKLYGGALVNQYRMVASDKHLATYVAFDLYYAKLFNLDLSQVKEKPARKF